MAASAPFDHVCKLLIVGDAGVGKTSFLERYVQHGYATETYHEIGGGRFPVKERAVDFGGQVVKVQLWDTAGKERFPPLKRCWCQVGHGIFVAYDVTNKTSFNSVHHWMGEIDKQASKDIGFRLVLIGCKSDLAESGREVSYQEGAALADTLGVQFLETSAKLDHNVDEAVDLLVSNYLVCQRAVVLTLVSVEATETSGKLTLSVATIGGDMFEVMMAAEGATVAAAVTCICSERRLRHVKLVTIDGALLEPEQPLPGVCPRASGRGCMVQ